MSRAKTRPVEKRPEGWYLRAGPHRRGPFQERPRRVNVSARYTVSAEAGVGPTTLERTERWEADGEAFAIVWTLQPAYDVWRGQSIRVLPPVTVAGAAPIVPSADTVEWTWFGGLYLHLVNNVPLRALLDYLLNPAVLARARELLRPLGSYRHRNGPSHPYAVRDEDLWELYALGRINDFLLFPFHDGNLGAEQWQARLRFFEALGFTRLEERPYHPFYHEIIAVHAWNAGPPAPQISRERWPGLRFGDLLFARAGAELASPGNFIDPFVAERSTLYWTYRRYARPTEDLSFGWGSNSQWRTAFRRDYDDSEGFHFNVDGRFDLASEVALATSVQRAAELDSNADLPLARRREMLIHRCFVASRHFLRHDAWPYRDTLSVRQDTPIWPWRDRQAAGG